ncbi:hypothetical protein P7K49_040366, partial [Saguinus oedipus]
ALSQGVGAFFMSICCTVLPHLAAVYSLFACRGSDLPARVCPVAAWWSLSVMAGCLGNGRLRQSWAVLKWGCTSSAMMDAPPSPGCT